MSLLGGNNVGIPILWRFCVGEIPKDHWCRTIGSWCIRSASLTDAMCSGLTHDDTPIHAFFLAITGVIVMSTLSRNQTSNKNPRISEASETRKILFDFTKKLPMIL